MLQFVAFALYVTPLLYMIEKVRSSPAHKLLFVLLPCRASSTLFCQKSGQLDDVGKFVEVCVVLTNKLLLLSVAGAHTPCQMVYQATSSFAWR